MVVCRDTVATYAGTDIVGLNNDQPCHLDMHKIMDAVDAEQCCLVYVDGAAMRMDGINLCHSCPYVLKHVCPAARVTDVDACRLLWA